MVSRRCRADIEDIAVERTRSSRRWTAGCGRSISRRPIGSIPGVQLLAASLESPSDIDKARAPDRTSARASLSLRMEDPSGSWSGLTSQIVSVVQFGAATSS